MPSTLRSLSIATAILASAVSSTAGAQAQRPPLTIEQPYYQTIAFNPILLPWGIFSADYERALSPAITLGVGGTYAAVRDEDKIGWMDVKALYYPNETALEGFGVGLTAGFVSAHSREDADFFLGQPEYRRQDSGATLGVVADYNWLVGKRERFLIGLGIGAKRVLKDVQGGSALNQVYPSGRFSIGLAF
jgi:hypothetical protein